MKNKVLVSLTFLAIIGVLSYKFYKKPETVKLPKYSSYLSCDGTPTDLNVILKSDIYFLKSALPETEQEKNVLFSESIIFQNLYTFMNLGQRQNLILKSSNLSNRPKVKILAIEDVAYPFNATFESQHEIFFFRPEKQVYLNKIFPLGQIQKGDPAIKVSYEYSNEVHLCLNSEDRNFLNQIEYLQPKDPFFAYFSVAPSERRLMRNEIWNSEARINPCMDPDAIGGGDVAPFALWYHWLPKAKGKDSENKSYDCTAIFDDNVVNKVQVKAFENPEKAVRYFSFNQFDNLERPIRASIILGARNNYDFQEFNEDEVSKFINLYTSGIDQEGAKNNLPILKKRFDTSFSTMLIVLWNMTKHLKIHSMESKIEKFYMTIYLRGKLHLSKKDLELKFTVARNKQGMEGSEYFSQRFAQSIAKDDIVIYEGHAGYGSMLNGAIDHLRQNKETILDKSLKYQIVALYSCNSQHYFHPEIFPKSGPNMRRDIITSGGGYNDPTSKASIALIASLDSYLYNESYVPFGLWSKQFKTDNFLILTNN